MLEEALLRERFADLLARERQALSAYSELAATLADPAQRAQIEQVCRDKRRHIELTRRLLEIVD